MKSGSLDFEINFDAEGNLEFKILNAIKSQIGQLSKFQITRVVNVRGSSGSGKQECLFSKSFAISSNVVTFIISKEVRRKLDESFEYFGSNISIKPHVEFEIIKSKKKIKKYFFDCVSTQLKKRSKVEGIEKEAVDLKDKYNFMKNFLVIPFSSKVSVIFLFSFIASINILNLYIGIHDQFCLPGERFYTPHRGEPFFINNPLIVHLVIGVIIYLYSVFQWNKLNKSLGLRDYAIFVALRTSEISRTSKKSIRDIIKGKSNTDLINPTLRIVAYNTEKGKEYTENADGRSLWAESFSRATHGIVLYSKTVDFIRRGDSIENYFNDEISFSPIFDCLYPKLMIGPKHGLDVEWRVQLLEENLVDQNVLGKGKINNQNFFSQGMSK